MQQDSRSRSNSARSDMRTAAYMLFRHLGLRIQRSPKVYYMDSFEGVCYLGDDVFAFQSHRNIPVDRMFHEIGHWLAAPRSRRFHNFNIEYRNSQTTQREECLACGFEAVCLHLLGCRLTDVYAHMKDMNFSLRETKRYMALAKKKWVTIEIENLLYRHRAKVTRTALTAK